MKYRLTIIAEAWQKVTSHLLRDDSEHLAFLLGKLSSGDRSIAILVSDVILIDDSNLDYSGCYGLSLRLGTLLDVMNRANKEKATLVEIHSHPFSRKRVRFSFSDLAGQREMVQYLRDALPTSNYGAIVLGQDSFEGYFWPVASGKPYKINEMRVLGDNIHSMRSGRRVRSLRPAEKTIYDSQISALGENGQKLIEYSRVGVVGLGGVGSIVATELAYLGVGEFLLVDDDSVEDRNLNRLVGAYPDDVSRAKVQTLSEHIQRINPRATVQALEGNVRSADSLSKLKGVDVVFGCVDTDSGRLILNELALAYTVPYIDCGVGIIADDGKITDAGGRVIVWLPGRPCLLCCREIDTLVAAQELESDKETEFREAFGYVANAKIKAPAVISLNGTIASMAVTEFLALITGYAPTHNYTYYDMLAQSTGQRITKEDKRCIPCSFVGKGDEVNIERYSRHNLPRDIPHR